MKPVTGTARPRGEQYIRGGAASIQDRGTDFGGGLGVDVRLGIGSAATPSATVNPDFGQVERDPAVLNLSVFETFFPEKRTFFIEDSRTLVANFPSMPMFHSRRI